MRILFLTDNFPPEVNAPASRTYEHARRWVEAGAEVTVITCAPNFPKGKVYPGYRNSLVATETMDGIKVVRVLSYITANEGFVKRSLDYLSFAFSSFFAGLFQKYDLIVATSPQFFTTFAGAALSFIRRKPWVFEVRDLWPESLVAVGAARNPLLIGLLERIELFLYRNAARVIVVTDAFRDNLVRRGIDPAKIDTITNGADLALWKPRPIDQKLRAELGLTGKFVIGYVGTHGMAHGLDFIVRAASKLPGTQIHFLFIGDGAEKDNVVELARSLGVTNVSFQDPIPKEAVPQYLACMDAALVPLRRSDTFKTVIPSKIFEAAAMGKPILLGVEGQAEAIVNEYQAGLTFVPEDEESFLATIRSLADDPDLYARLQQGGAALAQAYDRDKLAGRMLSLLEGVSRKQLNSNAPPDA